MAKAVTPYSTREEAVEIARGLATRFRERVWEAEELCRLSDANVADLLESGLLNLEAPRRWGGAELNIDALFEVTETLAEGCGSSGWVYMIWAAHVWHVAQFPEAVQERILTGPKPIISSVVNTKGGARAVGGGYVLSLRGSFSSGCDHAEWILPRIEMPIHKDAPPERCWLLVPMTDVTIIDDWNTVGLRGTGSKSVQIDEVFVPSEYVVPANSFDASEFSSQIHESPLFSCANGQVGATQAAAGPAIGIAKSMVRAFEERCRKAAAAGADQTPALLRLAKAAAEVDSAYELVLKGARRFCHAPPSEVTEFEALRYRRDVAYSTQLCRQAVNSLFEASGSESVYSNRDFSRIWRDVNVATAHAAQRFDVHGLNYSLAAMSQPAASR